MDLDIILRVGAFVIAVLVGFFGNNWLQQATGSSIFEWIRKPKDSLSKVFRKPLSASSVAPPGHRYTSAFLDYIKGSGVIDVFQPPLTRNLISATLYKQAGLKKDHYIDAAFEQLNQQRRIAGKEEYYSHPRYRVIRKPEFSETSQRQYILQLADTNFEYAALLNEQGVDIATKEYIQEMVDKFVASSSFRFQSTDPYLNLGNVGMLGVMIVLITSDGCTLLRRRGKNVMEYPDTWDISFSGFCGKQVFKDGQFDIGNTVEYELDQEIKLSGDPREISFTGFHLSTITKTTVMLGFWKVAATSSELEAFINRKPKRVFLKVVG